MKAVFKMTVVAAALVSVSAFATNRDVNNFLAKVDNAASQPFRGDLYNEAVNAYDNLNARDRMVVAGYQDKMPHPGMVADVIGSGEARGHQANVPAGWKPELTRAQIAEAHRPAHGTPGQSVRKANVSGPASQPVATGVPVNTVNPISTAIISVTKATDAKLALKADKTELATEIQERKDGDAQIHHLLNAEGVSRIKTDNHLQGEIDGHETRISDLENAPKPKDGKNGADGKDGRDGAKGDKGDTGAAGTDGLNGKDGVDGKDADMTLVNTNTKSIQQQRADFAQRSAVVDQRIAQQKADQQKVNKAVASKLDNHEGRITSLEQQSNSKFAALDKRIDDVKKHASAGTASAFAQANIPQVMAGGEFGIGAGAGTYDGESAIAVGASYAPRDNVVLKATVSTDTMHNFGAGAGVMVSFR